MRPAHLLIVLATLFFAASAQAENIVTATLLSEQDVLVAGQKLRVGVLLEPKPGWHTYWENPGDAGMATEIAWALPPGFTASAIDWPVPHALAEGPLMTFSYDGNVLLPVTLTAPSTLPASNYTLKARVSWLVCKEICIPESADLELTLPVAAATTPSPAAPLFAEHDRQRQKPLEGAAHYRIEGKEIILSAPLPGVDAKDISAAFFFPRALNIVHYSAPQKHAADKDMLHMTLERAGDMPQGDISGILALTANGTKHYYDVTFTTLHTAGAADAITETPWLPMLMLLALLGGVVLNLMPCVLPVLSLKALAVVQKSGHDHATVVRMGVAYTLGILISFAAIAGTLLVLKEGGEAIGWGYQMQSPAFVGFLIYLLFLVGLNLSGLFHLPVLLGNIGGSMADESSAKGSFFTGVLAAAVATPCTAPFMASAVGAALTLPAWQAMLIFESLGLGLALPFLAISLFPAARRFLPRPGAWMDTLKQLLAFPMYASVIWLLWVLVMQTGAGGMVVATSGMLAMLLALWMKSLFADGSTRYRILAVAIYVAVFALSLPALSRMEIATPAMPGSHAAHGVETVPYSKAKLDELKNAGKPVFVDATAAWCITCQVNARIAIHTEKTMEAFKTRGVTLMIADWTRRNQDITAFLSSFGYKGVPLYVFYPAHGGKPVVLPQLLTEETVIHTIQGE